MFLTPIIKIKNVFCNCCLKTNILCVACVPLLLLLPHFPEDEHSGSHSLWHTANTGLNIHWVGVFHLKISSTEVQGRKKRGGGGTTRGSNMRPFYESSRPGWTLANILSYPEVLALFHCGQQCSSQGLWSRLHWSHHLTLVHVTFHSGPRFPLLPPDGVLGVLMDWSCL